MGGSDACVGTQESLTFDAFPALRLLTSSPWAAMLLNRSSAEAQGSPLGTSAIFQGRGSGLAGGQSTCSGVETTLEKKDGGGEGDSETAVDFPFLYHHLSEKKM